MYSGIIYSAISPGGKKYYGRTLSSLKIRKRNHLKFAKMNKNTYFYNALRKYGDLFQWEIIETHETADKKLLNEILNEREIFWISKEKTHLKEFGYNGTKGGEGFIGKHKEETKEKLRKINLGHIVSDETRKKISENGVGMKGKNHSKEARNKMSKLKKGKDSWMKGKKHSLETKEKMSESQRGEKNHNYGNKFSEETKRKMSESAKGRISNRKGKTLSEETKSKIRESIKKKWADKIK